MSNLSQAKENLKIEKKRLKKARESGDKNAVKICQGNINQYKDRIKGLEKSEKSSKGKKSKGSKKGSSSGSSKNSNRSFVGGCLTAPFRLLWWIIKKLFGR